MRPVAVSGLRKRLAFVKVTLFTCRVHLLNIPHQSFGSDSGVLTSSKQDLQPAGRLFKESSGAFNLISAAKCQRHNFCLRGSKKENVVHLC